MAKKDSEEIRRRNQQESESLDSSRTFLGIQQAITKELEKQADKVSERVFDETVSLEQAEKKRALTTDEQKAIADIFITNKKYLKDQKEGIQVQRQSLRTLIDFKKIAYQVNTGFESYVGYLMTADKSIKEISLQFGIAGGRASDIRTAIEDSAIQAGRLNMSVEDLTSMYSGYVEQVGRTVALNGEQMEAMAALAKGTGLAAEGAAQLAGQFEMMGMDIVSVNKTVEGILETSERMGVNATKVLKAVGNDFKRLQTYTFRKGVQGMGDMAAYSEKFKISMDDALGAAEKSRRLEGAVELAAKLQVLGGEFAKSDPFEMLFLSRNDPEQFQKKISELTKGMATLNKVGDEFQFQLASPMARDMLEQAGAALGISTEKMTEMALQQAKINKMRRDMFNSGYTKDQREIIEGLSQMDSSTGKFFINVKGMRRDIANLSGDELEYLKKQSASLEDRAKNAQTFDDQFKVFMLELKAVGLPLLQGINETLGTIRGWMDKLTDVFKDFGGESKDILTTIGKYMGWFLLFKPILGKFVGMVGKGIFNKVSAALSSGGGGVPAAQTMTGGAAGAKGGFGAAIGKGAGVGLAGLGIGVGIGEAAKGIAELAKAMKDLDSTQIWGLAGTVVAISAGMYLMIPAMSAMIPLVAALGVAGTAGAIGLGALGLAALGVGYGIKLAGEGIKLVGEGIGTVVSSITGGVSDIITASKGIAEIDLSGLVNNVDDLERVGKAFGGISAVLRGSKEDYAEVKQMIDSIAKADFSNLKALNNLNQLFAKPLQVEFANKSVNLISNVTLEIDGEKFIQKLNIAERVALSTKRLSQQGIS